MWGSFGQLTRHVKLPDEFRPTWREFCPTPGAKFVPFRPTSKSQLATIKRFARSRWGEIRRISPHVKKEKNFGGAKIKNLQSKPLRFHPTHGTMQST
jgi:hypothetical protein